MEVMKKKKNLIWLISIPIFVIVFSQRLWNSSFDFNQVWKTVSQYGSNNDFSIEKQLVDGLLAPGFDEESCLSRYQFNSFRKSSPFKPSPFLLSKLRSYENLHRRCGPRSSSFKQSLQILDSDVRNFTFSDCKYNVIITRDGLGNRMLAIISAFFYALLTDRVLLVDQGNGLDDLFCEPFLNSSWFLPLDFPLRKQFNSFQQSNPRSLGNILRNGMMNSMEESESLPPYMYLHLSHDASDHDRLFFCDRQQDFLEKFPWLIMETNNYLIPGMFLIPSFREELHNQFPAKDTVFHHLSRYLFHPRNEVWGLISRSYKPYLTRANETIGIQIRVFGSESGTFQDQMKQLISCTQKKNLLPNVEFDRSSRTSTTTTTTTQIKNNVKVVLVTSLSAEYLENLKEMYLEHPTVNGDVVAVYQPSHEGYQNSDQKMHNRKALAEIYLLSLSDVLVTSSWSTFGYVAQGLGGLKPWILYKPEEKIYGPLEWWVRFKTRDSTTAAEEDWPCSQAVSMEPCYHTPPVCDCIGMNRSDGGNVLPFVRHCEDASWGLKLVDSN